MRGLFGPPKTLSVASRLRVCLSYRPCLLEQVLASTAPPCLRTSSTSAALKLSFGATQHVIIKPLCVSVIRTEKDCQINPKGPCHVCMYVYIYIYIYVYVYIYIYIYIYVYTYIYIYIYIFVCFIYLFMYLFIYLFIYLSIYLCMYIYIYVEIYVHIHFYTYTYALIQKHMHPHHQHPHHHHHHHHHHLYHLVRSFFPYIFCLYVFCLSVTFVLCAELLSLSVSVSFFLYFFAYVVFLPICYLCLFTWLLRFSFFCSVFPTIFL